MEGIKMADNKELKGKLNVARLDEVNCVWANKGIIYSRLCDHDDNCPSCLFDLGMRKALGIEYGENGIQADPSWKEYLKKHFKGGDRPCCHAILGRIDGPKLCTFNYECHHCPFDQMLDDMDYAQSGLTAQTGS